MQRITSKDNSIIKHIKKLKEKKYRNQYNEYIVEGAKIISEAVRENANIKQIIICDGCENNELIETHLKYELAKYECIYVPNNIFKMLTDVENPQGVLAVIEKSGKNAEIRYDEDIIVVLDDVQDPGNVGTILRTIDSVGLKQVIVSKGTADIYNSKVIRSTMGAIFRVNVIECENIKQTLQELKKNNFKITVTSLEAKKTIYDIDYNKKVIVVGNEANGVSKDVQKLADEKVIIPMLGNTESLNVSIATGIVLYEYVRQKI
ncbi:MAG: RNA methyltransferase [Clostridia bacterium]|nr:RNA methyltransferase [Clostridia bacterium]